MLRILVPLDGSRAAEEALHHAFSISQIFPAEFTLLRVIDSSSLDTDVDRDSTDFALWRYQAQSYLDQLRDEYAAQDLSIRCEVTEGRAADCIVAAMDRVKPDLLIMTRYGRGDAKNFTIGGTAQKILSSTDCSVLLLDPRRATTQAIRYQRILVPVDTGKSSDCAVAIAAMIAEFHDAAVLLVHVTEEPQLPANFPATRKAQELLEEMRSIIRSEAKRRLLEFVARFPAHLHVETRALISPDTSFAIESMAEEHDSDLLLLHAREQQAGAHDFDPVNHALLLYSHRPLFILRSPTGEGLASNFRSIYLDESHAEVT